MIDVAAGRADIVCDAVITASVQAKAGRVKAYGIVGEPASKLLPDLPTLAEQGLPNVAIRCGVPLRAKGNAGADYRSPQ